MEIHNPKSGVAAPGLLDTQTPIVQKHYPSMFFHSQCHLMAHYGCCNITHHICILGGCRKGREGKRCPAPLGHCPLRNFSTSPPNDFFYIILAGTLSDSLLSLMLQFCFMRENQVLGSSWVLSLPIWPPMLVWTSVLALTLTFSFVHQS